MATTGQRITAEFAQLCLAGILRGPEVVLYVKDLQSRFMLVSEATAAKHGLTQESMVGLTDAELFDEHHASFAYAEEQELMRTGRATSYRQVRETWPDRPDTWALTTKRPLRDRTGRIVGLVGMSQDVTARVHAEERAAQALAELAAAESELRAVLDVSPDAIVRHGPDARITYVNPAAEHLLRLPRHRLVGRCVSELDAAAVLRPWEEAVRDVLSTGRPRELELPAGTEPQVRWFQSRLTPVRDPAGDVTAVLVSSRDITDLKLTEQELARRAMTDALTGLANRALLLDRLRQALARLERGGAGLALLFVDLDRFKAVNDEHGHHVGDLVLVEVARRLERAVRGHDTVARIGGDEFVVLCEPMPGHEAEALGRRVVAALGAPVPVEGRTLGMSASVGVAVLTSDADGIGPEGLLTRADRAMYAVKRSGRDGMSVWTDPEGEP